ncbi:MAG: hypothetical protein KDC54_18075 [Lewinella sp.]|nr:hypothetical protein [Lewinella sp.]
MKARTQAAKRRLKGRRPIEGVPRTPEGRIRRVGDRSEAAISQETVSVAVEARQRVHAVPIGFDHETKKETFSSWPAEIAKRPEAGYVLGRIYLDGNLGKEGIAEQRLEVGNRYAIEMARYHGLTGVPFPSARAQNLFSVHGHDGEVSEERAKAARQAADRMMLLDGDLNLLAQGRGVKTAVYNVCFMDIEEARMWYRHAPHMHALLIMGLDALLWRYGLEQEKQIS